MLGFGVRLLEVLAWRAADVGRLLGKASDLCVSKNCANAQFRACRSEDSACLRPPVFVPSSYIRVTPRDEDRLPVFVDRHIYYKAPARTLYSTTTTLTLLTALTTSLYTTLRPSSNTHHTIIHSHGLTNKYSALHILQ